MSVNQLPTIKYQISAIGPKGSGRYSIWHRSTAAPAENGKRVTVGPADIAYSSLFVVGVGVLGAFSV